MFTGVLFSKTAPRTSRHLFLFPFGCIWKVVGEDMAVTTRPASIETTIKNFNVTKKIIERWKVSGWMEMEGGGSVKIVDPDFYREVSAHENWSAFERTEIK